MEITNILIEILNWVIFTLNNKEIKNLEIENNKENINNNQNNNNIENSNKKKNNYSKKNEKTDIRLISYNIISHFLNLLKNLNKKNFNIIIDYINNTKSFIIDKDFLKNITSFDIDTYLNEIDHIYNNNNLNKKDNYTIKNQNVIIYYQYIFDLLFKLAIAQFFEFYSKPGNFEFLLNKFNEFKNSILNNDVEKTTKIISEIFLKELTISNNDILEKWIVDIDNLKKSSKYLSKNSKLKPHDFIIQLNGLYTHNFEILNNNISKKDIINNLKSNNEYTEKLTKLIYEYKQIFLGKDKKIGVYDHPVEIFSSKEKHELLNFLEEFDKDIEFEKSKNIFNKDYRVFIIVSISVTHKNIENIVSKWIKLEISNLNLKNISIFLLDNKTIDDIKKELLNSDFNKYTVEGNYSNHFNALKYTQLLFEKGFNKKAGFKLDTDEGIRSQKIYSITSKTWFELLCNEFIDAKINNKNPNNNDQNNINCKKFQLSFIVGEYVNNTDIKKLGFKNAFFEPDVKYPSSYNNNSLFFNKGFAHANSTYIYNDFFKKNKYSKGILSHPVVKGGGYGITNSGLKNSIPFCPSFITRAEDQAFYYVGLAKGLRGIFIGELRIAHYKEKYAHSESKTTWDRLIEDMHRLIFFSEMGKFLNNKEIMDPMPGVFISKIPFTQAFFNIFYNSFKLFLENKKYSSEYLILHGLERLIKLYMFLYSTNYYNTSNKEPIKNNKKIDNFNKINKKISIDKKIINNKESINNNNNNDYDKNDNNSNNTNTNTIKNSNMKNYNIKDIDINEMNIFSIDFINNLLNINPDKLTKIDKTDILEKIFYKENEHWKNFVKKIESLDKQKVKNFLKEKIIN